MKIYKETVSELLWDVLLKLMDFPELNSFRLVGGTCLSLLLGHRMSVDIDLFTDAEYGSIDFNKVNDLLVKEFNYVDIGRGGNKSMGNNYFIGLDKNKAVKLDLYYTDSFKFPVQNYKSIRLSHIEEIAAMKFEVIGNGGRKKDFWDIHELFEHFSLNEMIDYYLSRYPFSYGKDEIIEKLTDFKKADFDPDPICLKGKYWDLIKVDIEEKVEESLK